MAASKVVKTHKKKMLTLKHVLKGAVLNIQKKSGLGLLPNGFDFLMLCHLGV